MNLIMKLEILILFQKTLTQCAPNSRQYTQAGYYLPFHNEEYSWPKSDVIQTRKTHRRRKKYNDYYISAEMDYGPKRLQCKCTCKKRKCDNKPIPNYEQDDPCCQSCCDNKPDASTGIYMPTQYPDTVDTEIYMPTQFPTVDSRIFTPVPYPSMTYPAFDLSEIGKMFPWLTWGMTQTTKEYTDGQKDKDTASTKNDKDKTSKSDDRDKTSTKDDKNKTTITDGQKDKDTASTKDDRDKSSKSDDRDKTSKSDYRDKTSTKDNKNKTTITDEKDRPDKDKKDKISPREKPAIQTEESTTPETTLSPKTEESTTPESTLSTQAYGVVENMKKLFHYLPKQKKCLRNNCVLKDTDRKVGRYYKDDIVERPTVASYLNGNWRRNNFPRKLYEDKPRYGIIPIPDELAMKVMNELRN